MVCYDWLLHHPPLVIVIRGYGGVGGVLLSSPLPLVSAYFHITVILLIPTGELGPSLGENKKQTKPPIRLRMGPLSIASPYAILITFAQNLH